MGIEEEIVNRILNCLPSKNPEKNWMYEIAVRAGLIPAQAPSESHSRSEGTLVGYWGPDGFRILRRLGDSRCSMSMAFCQERCSEKESKAIGTVPLDGGKRGRCLYRLSHNFPGA